MKPAEAAVVCGVSTAAMRQRLCRARAEIARQLDADQAPWLAAVKAVAP
jgi:DNA-directed RNA polymerase specialized sigma24 family protein